MPDRLFDQIDCFALQHADQPAVRTGAHTISYGELGQRAKRVSEGLRALNLAQQSRVVILSGNRNEFFEIWQGAAMAGFVFTPLNARLAAPEVAFIVNDSSATVLFVDPLFHDLVAGIEHQLTAVKQIISLGKHPKWPCYADWRDGHNATGSSDGVLPDATVVQMYTSGTTGSPKGVELSHRSVLACARAMMGEQSWPVGQVSLVTAPLFHTAGSCFSHCALQSGGTVVLLEELSPEAVLSAIEDYSVTEALLVPALVRRVLESPRCRTTDCSSLRRILYGASPMPLPVLQQAIEIFACDFEQGYGMTETVGPVAMLRPRDHDGGAKMKSCGKAVPGTNIRVVDEQGNDCPVNQVGEIIISGVQIMKGYWHRPADTQKAIKDGWLYSGDAGFFDSDGYLYIHDRLKDMICSGAENIYPAEVENSLAGCTGVADVAVIGVPDDQWGEAVKAIVVAQKGVPVSADAIIAHARQSIAGFKCPKTVDFVDSIPRNPSGKILKKILREPYWLGVDRRVS